MYRRSDPRWNRTLQHISDNIEHVNESAQENLYGFAQRYVSPCFASVAQCMHACAAPCLPAPNDRRRQQRGRVPGRAESSFDFYDDWDADESDGLLGWRSDNLDRFLGGASTYGATAQPARQPAMGYGPRSRNPRYGPARRKSTALSREPTQDRTLIPSSSYFGFLGRLPWRIGGKGLRYKPSAADLTDHPGGTRAVRSEEQPLFDDGDAGDEGLGEAPSVAKVKRHNRQRSDTRTSGHTTDSLSSRGDIFPSEDELDDAVPLDEEFTIALERRNTGQWFENSSSTSKHPSGSRVSTRSTSSRNTHDAKRPSAMDEAPAQDALYHEQERPPPTPSSKPITPQTSSPQPLLQMAIVRSAMPPLVRSPASETLPPSEAMPLPNLFDAQNMPRGNSFYIDGSDLSSLDLVSVCPSSLKKVSEASSPSAPDDTDFVPARLPQFGTRVR